MNKKYEYSGQLLLLEDVLNLGQKGDLVQAKPGFIRNFLLPKGKALLADKRTVRMQNRLKEERAKQALLDKKESEELSAKIKDTEVGIKVKTDKEGNLYGSVTALDIVKLLEQEKIISCERRSVILSKPIKKVGTVKVELRLKEGVSTSFFLKVSSENQETLVEKQTLDKKEEAGAEVKESNLEHEKRSHQSEEEQKEDETHQMDAEKKE